MKKLHVYMLNSFIGPFVATFFISMFVLIMQSLWLYIDDLVGKGLEIRVIGELLYFMSLTLVPMGMPLAVLLASIMTFGNLGENYELTAMKSAGISLFRIMKPLIFLIIILTISAFYFSNNVLPYATLKARTLLMDIRRHSPELSFKEGVFVNDIDKYSIKVEKIDKETGVMYDMLIYDHSDKNANYQVTLAESGTMRSNLTGELMTVELFDGTTYTDEGLLDPGKKVAAPYRIIHFGKQRFGIQMDGNELQRSNEDDYKSHYAMQDISQLNQSIDSISRSMQLVISRRTQELMANDYIKSRDRDPVRDSVLMQETQGEFRGLDSLWQGMDIKEQARALESARSGAERIYMTRDLVLTNNESNVRRLNIEWHKKFSLSFACFIFFFIGAPLGAIIRKGGLGMPVIVSILLFIIYYVISMMGERAAREGSLMPWQGMWISSILLLPMGAWLTYISMNDSAVLSADAYKNFIKSLSGFFDKFTRKRKPASHA